VAHQPHSVAIALQVRDVQEHADVALWIAHERGQLAVGLLLHHQVQRERVVARHDDSTPAICAVGHELHGRGVARAVHGRRRRDPVADDAVAIEMTAERTLFVRQREGQLSAVGLHR
jgi:hypothetical protein